MSRDPNPMMPAPSGPAYSSVAPVVVQCPNCGSTQFFGEKRMTGLGRTMLWCGLIGTAISILLMFFFIGFCTIFLTVPMLIAAPFLRKYVNICAKCRRTF